MSRKFPILTKPRKLMLHWPLSKLHGRRKVTKDDCPVIFHDSFIATEEKGVFVEKRVTDITLSEFLSYGPQTELGKVVNKHAKDRPIMFSSFQPDVVLMIRKLQSTYPIYFLTNGGSEIYKDVRWNSLEEAIKVCIAGGLQGIVSEVRAILRDPNAVTRIKDSNLCLLIYGHLNNIPEKVYMQHLMGVEGVIVDLVGEITEAVSDLNN
ncbi:hypothetical protein ACLB2K_020701 [Fragaria x ananassa]